jgi:hypothetical protein
MASTINATTNGIVNIGDSVATLALQTGGTTAVAIDTAQIVSLSKSLALLGSTSGSVTIAAPAVAGTQSYTLPTGVPAANGYALTSTTAGVMSWAASGGSPGGSDTQVQFNDGGSTFGGDAGLTYNKTTDDLTIAGNLVIGTNGKGIDFSATPGTGTSELLNDYEEGTFTPDLQIGGASTGITYLGRAGSYVKIGRMVYILAGVTLSNKGSLTGNLTLAGLPFASANTDYKEPWWRGSYSNFVDYSSAVTTSSTALQIRSPSNIGANLTDSSLQNNSSISFVGCYLT